MQVWDVETGKCLYRFDVSDDMGNYVLSPDGQHVAMRLYDRSTEHITYSVVDARTGRQKMITGPAPNAKTPAFPLAFTSDGQLLTVDTCIDLSDVEQGRRIRQMGDDLQRLDRDQFAASANGKLAAWLSPQGNTVRLFETATGKMLGASPLPDAGDRASESENLVDNLAFSPDGRELAALVGGRHIYVWSIDSGRLVADFPIAPRARNWNPSDLSAILQWLPDSQAWLIADDQIVDRLSGKAICMLPDLRDERGLETGERRMLDRSHVLVEFCVNPPEHATVLKSFPLDVDQLEKARAAMPGFK
jgi:WD40 repeat protein